MKEPSDVKSEFADELPLNAQLELASQAVADLRSKLVKIAQEQKGLSDRIANGEDVSGILRQEQSELVNARRRIERGIAVMTRHAQKLEGQVRS